METRLPQRRLVVLRRQPIGGDFKTDTGFLDFPGGNGLGSLPSESSLLPRVLSDLTPLGAPIRGLANHSQDV